MRRHVVGYVVAIVVVAALLACAVPGMLRGPQEQGGAVDPQAAGQDQEVAARPGCGARGVAGVSLPCLGAEASGDAELSEAAVAVVNVWAWWCGPCREELPLMARFAQEHPEYRVVGVHADVQAAAGAALLEELGVGLPSFQDADNSFAGALRLPSVVPITVVVRSGEVAGVLPKAYSDLAELERDVRGVLA
ncbi:redoxin domain-containing protein [Corynebacterium sp. zg-331]|uniref:TlpA family protein disulfide reductase n=1 Tax=unclassified Corynebacterium TaxID=2624378 RepID=UPI00128DB81F|nr:MULTISPECIES: redoxin domain-containing protein [unclassified Corynebacterium]MBC3186569.1 redoxin domain-containing protein [Corynebacterium sp. zg-331]MPV53053.1 redoxin domain-containing protein [Corynebacterium sp. zg331]